MAQVTLFPAAGANEPIDGHVYRGAVDQTFAAIRAGSGMAFDNTGDPLDFALLRATATTDQYQYLTRSIFGFSLSAIPTNATITAATLSLFGTGKAADLGTATTLDIVQATPAGANTLENADYENAFGTTVFADKAYADYSTSAYNDFTLSAAGIAYLQTKIGTNAFLGARLGWDTDNSFGGTWANAADMRFSGNFADQTGTSKDPKLVIDYTTPDTGGSRAFFM